MDPGSYKFMPNPAESLYLEKSKRLHEGSDRETGPAILQRLRPGAVLRPVVYSECTVCKPHP